MAEHLNVEQHLRRGLEQAAAETDLQRVDSVVAAAELTARLTSLPAGHERGEQPTAPVGPSTGTPRRVVLAAAAAAAAAVTVAGVAVWSTSGRSSDEPAADCAQVLRFQGRSWMGFGELRRVPVRGHDLGTGVRPRCDDGNGVAPAQRVRLTTIAGVSSSVGMLDDSGSVWVPSGTTRQAAPLSRLDETLPCRLPAGSRLAGRIAGVARPGGGAPGTVPYTATFEVRAADNAGGFPAPQYSAVTVPLRITKATAGGTDQKMLTDALDGYTLVTATVTCDLERYQATALSAAP